jgi:mercuric ion transport protein
MPDGARTMATAGTQEAAPAAGGERRQELAATGGILGALAASSCCILPLVLTVFGVSGAWMAGLRALAPYQPVFIAVSAGMLGYGFYLVYWKPKRAAAQGAACARPVVPNRAVRAVLWGAAFVVLLNLSFNIWFPPIAPYLP